MRGGGAIYNALESNPYQPIRVRGPRYTLCETCDRTIETKDWNTHQAGKKHQQAVEELRNAEKAEKKANRSWGDEVNDAVQEDETDAKGWGEGDDNAGYTTQSHSKGGSGTCHKCGQAGHMKSDCPEARGGGGGGGGGGQEW